MASFSTTSSSATSSAIIPFSSMNFNNWGDIVDASRITGVSAIIESNIQKYHSINVQKSMNDLKQIGKLLQLAYAGSKGFTCSEQIIKILSTYQDVINNSCSATSTFVNTSLKALTFHKMALTSSERGVEINKVLAIIAKCGELAGQMALASQMLVDQSEELCTKATDALVAATHDDNVTTEAKMRIENTLREAKEREAGLKEKTGALAKQIEEERKREKRALRSEEKLQRRAFAISLISGLTKPLVDAAKEITSIPKSLLVLFQGADKHEQELLDKRKQLAIKEVELTHAATEDKKRICEKEIAEIKVEIQTKEEQIKQTRNAFNKAEDLTEKLLQDATKRVEKIAEDRAKLQEMQRESNVSLAETVKRLQNQHEQGCNLATAITSLELTVSTLGKIKTVFENTRLYWVGVRNHCADLTDTSLLTDIADLGLRSEIEDSIRQSGLSWLTLGKVVHSATLAIQDVKRKVDTGMTHLPTREEVPQIISLLSTEMLTDIQSDTAQLE